MKIIDHNGNNYQLIYKGDIHWLDDFDFNIKRDFKFQVDCSDTNEMINVALAHFNYWISQEDDQIVVNKLKSDCVLNFIDSVDFITPFNLMSSLTISTIEVYDQLSYGNFNFKIVGEFVQFNLAADYILFMEKVQLQDIIGESVESYFENQNYLHLDGVYYFIKSIEVDNLISGLKGLFVRLNIVYKKFGLETIDVMNP